MSDPASTIATAIGLLNDGDVDGYISTLYDPTAVFHGFPPAFTPDCEGITAFFHALRAGVPDASITGEDLVTDGDRVAVRFSGTGTHTAELFGTSATGQRIDVEGITIVHFSGDRVVERWNRLDDITFLT